MSKNNGKRKKGKPMKPGGKGRPSGLTPEIANKIVRSVRAGCYIQTSAAIVGIGNTTLWEWLKRGRDEEDTIYSELFDRVQTAQGMSEAEDLAIIGEASKEDWTAAAWRLERKFPHKFGKRVRIENANVTNLDDLPQGDMVLYDLDRLNVQELKQLKEILAKARNQGQDNNTDPGDDGHDPSGNGQKLLPPPPEPSRRRDD